MIKQGQYKQFNRLHLHTYVLQAYLVLTRAFEDVLDHDETFSTRDHQSLLEAHDGPKKAK